MSSVIVMPGSKEFAETLAGAKRRPKPPVSLVGKTLMLNTAVCLKFQCGGFSLGPNRPFAVVSPEAQQGPLLRALEENKLVDITGQDPKKGFKTRQGAVSAVTEEDTDKKAFIGRDGRGRMFVVTPKNKTEAKRFEREIRKTGTITSVDFEEQATGFGAITEEVVETSVPEPTRKVAKKNGRSKRSKRQSRR